MLEDVGNNNRTTNVLSVVVARTAARHALRRHVAGDSSLLSELTVLIGRGTAKNGQFREHNVENKHSLYVCTMRGRCDSHLLVGRILVGSFRSRELSNSGGVLIVSGLSHGAVAGYGIQ